MPSYAVDAEILTGRVDIGALGFLIPPPLLTFCLELLLLFIFIAESYE